MSSISEKILKQQNLLYDLYIRDCIRFAKSFILHYKKEAELYNEYLYDKYGLIASADMTEWRYYKHLSGKYFMLGTVDVPVCITSLDTYSNIEITRDSLRLHRRTRMELRKFEDYYNEVVAKYPYQELYIKSIITEVTTPVEDLLTLEDLTIVSYCSNYIEPQEHVLVSEIQSNLYNYKVVWGLSYYANSDSLYLATQIAIHYQYLLLQIISNRLSKAKTHQAHSFHVKNYLASHHYLDNVYDNLTSDQRLYLYRNLLYLDNHSGSNHVFKELVEKLFTRRNISVTNYVYNQKDTLNADAYVDYSLNQKLLNSKNLLYFTRDFTLNEVGNKEEPLALYNKREYDYNYKNIDTKLRNSLFSTLLTKDLEIIFMDLSDNVKYKLIPTIVDHYAYLCKHDKLRFVIRYTNPITNDHILLNSKDLFKLFVVTSYYANNFKITEFPLYRMTRLFRPNQPSTQDLLKMVYKFKYWYPQLLDEIKFNIPTYPLCVSVTDFQEYASVVYKLNIGLWLLTSNLSDLDNNGQILQLIDKLTTTDTFLFNDETVDEFLFRTKLLDIKDYSERSLKELSMSLIDTMFDNKLNTLFSNKDIQDTMCLVFNNFKSYTTQFISNYYQNNYLLAGVKDARYIVSKDDSSKGYYFTNYKLNIELFYKIQKRFKVDLSITARHGYKYYSDIKIDIGTTVATDVKNVNQVSVNMGGTEFILDDTSHSLNYLTRVEFPWDVLHSYNYSYKIRVDFRPNIRDIGTIHSNVFIPMIKHNFNLNKIEWMGTPPEHDHFVFLANLN